MDVNATPTIDQSVNTTGCCPRFDPKGWDGQTLHFKDKLCVRATTNSAMHVPLNMSKVFARVLQQMERAGAIEPERALVLSRDLSPWKAEHLFASDTPVEGEEMTRLSGDFITHAFEGSFSQVGGWVEEMAELVKEAGHDAGRIYMFYTTCPKCAKAYGQNYVVGVAELL